MPALATPTVKPDATGEEILIYLLKSNSAVRNLVAFRIEPDQVTSDKEPCIIYSLANRFERKLLNGNRTGYVRDRFTLFMKSRHRGTARALTAAVKAACNNRGSFSTIIKGLRVLQVIVVDNSERYESLPSSDGNITPERYQALDVCVHYREN